MNFKSVVRFRNVISYFVLLQSLGNIIIIIITIFIILQGFTLPRVALHVNSLSLNGRT